MRATLQRLPFLVILQGIGAIAMIVPAVHALQLGQFAVARAFLYSCLIFCVLFVLLVFALGHRVRSGTIRGQLLGLVGALILLPLMLAVPFREAIGTGGCSAPGSRWCPP